MVWPKLLKRVGTVSASIEALYSESASRDINLERGWHEICGSFTLGSRSLMDKNAQGKNG